MGWMYAILALVQQIFGLITEARAKQNAQNSAVDQGLIDHSGDGANSVADTNSSDAQNKALDDLQNQIENPTPIHVVIPKG